MKSALWSSKALCKEMLYGYVEIWMKIPMKIFLGVMVILMETWRSHSGDFHRNMFRGMKIFHGVIKDMKKVTSFIQKVEKIKIQF